MVLGNDTLTHGCGTRRPQPRLSTSQIPSAPGLRPGNLPQPSSCVPAKGTAARLPVELLEAEAPLAGEIDTLAHHPLL